MFRGADKSLARPTSRCVLFYGENISFDASIVIYINSTNIPFSLTQSFWSHCGPGVDSASNRNEYQVYFLGVKVAGV